MRTLAGGEPCTEQDETRAIYAEKITARDRLLDASRPATDLERVVRALAPHIGAYVELHDGLRLGISSARALPGTDDHPGSVTAGPGGVPVLSCSSGQLELVVVKPPGRREMPGTDWLRGWRG